MSQNLRDYTKAVYAMDAVVRRMPAAAWDNQSPCDEWCAREVLGHTMWGMKRVISGATGAPPPAEQAEADVAGSDPMASWASLRDEVLAALDQPGALQRVVAGPFGEMPLDNLLPIGAMDTLTHAWDVAESAGIDAHCDEDLMASGSAFVASMGDGLRVPGVLEAAIEPADGADATTQFANFMGRQRL